MAIAPVKKVHLVAHRSQREALVEELQRLGVMEIAGPEAAPGTSAPPQEERELESRLHRIDEALAELGPFLPAPTIVERIYPARPARDWSELERIIDSFDLDDFLARGEGCRRRIEHVRTLQERLDREKSDLTPWAGAGTALDTVRSTTRIVVAAGRLPSTGSDAFRTSLEAAGSAFVTVSAGPRYVHGIVIVPRREAPALEELFPVHSFQPLSLPACAVAPTRRLARIEEERRALDEEIDGLRREYRGFSRWRKELRIARDLLANRLDRRRVERDLGGTRETVALEGWVPARELPRLGEVLNRRFPLVSITAADPGPLDRVPVILENPPLVRPFGLVVDLYGRPRFGTLDPTPVLALFFAIFFGFCLTDAGYGLVLCLATGGLLLAAPRPLAPGSARFLRLFFLCGAATVVVGALAGGWFGVSVRWRLFDPLTDLMFFFAVALALGTAHLFMGIILRIVRLVRQGDRLGAFLDEGLWIALIGTLAGYGAARSGLLPGEAAPLLLGAAVASSLGITCFQGRARAVPGRPEWPHHLLWAGVTAGGTLWILGTWRYPAALAVLLCLAGEAILSRGVVRPVLGRLGLGLYALYGATGYLSDILSYSRLVALGLATGIVAMVINRMSTLAFAVPVVGFLFGALALAGGHLFNILINLLSAFVHSARLQYVEFFTKFYESGGKAFNPFRLVTRYITID